MDAVFCTDESQAATARERGIAAPIIVGARFYLAEDYHQKYYLRHDSILMREFEGNAPRAFVDSTLAARLNGYASGFGSPAHLHDELPRLGISPAAAAHLEKLVAHRSRIVCR